jgi:hypothetical protein
MKQIAGETGPIRRLVVLVPEQVLSEGRMARQVWQLAQTNHSQILLVARIQSSDQEMTARRQLATLASLLEDVWHHVEIKVVSAKSWIPALETITHPGDLLVCHKEQEVFGRMNRHQPLSTLLEQQFNLPVFILSGFSQKEKRSISHSYFKPVLIIAGFVLILVSFFMFEIRIDHLLKGTLGEILLIGISLIEFGLIWLLNNLAN